MAEEITITIAPDGETKIKVAGCAGSGCAKLTEQIEKDLGKTTKDVKTSEYFEKPKAKQTIGR